MSEFNFNIYGSSHGEKIGVTINGIAKGEIIDLIELQNYVNRRKSVNEVYSTARREPDIIEVISGIVGGKTDGNTVEIIIKNTNQNSKDYSDLKHLPRPSHADYPAYVKYNGQLDMSGGSFFSGRMTAPLVIAGGIAVQILNRKGIKFASYVSEIGGILQHTYKNTTTIHDARCTMHDNIIKAIEQAKAEGDSLGGTIEAIACNVPVGLGGALFDGIESETARLLFGIPAVKGVEFGLGFDISKLKGSEANDPYFYQNGEVQTKTNHSGGILGGMSTGMPITVRVAVKPTPSIAKEQQTVNLHTKQNATISIKGRHDSCIVPRAVVAVEACLALALLKKINNNTTTIDDKR